MKQRRKAIQFFFIVIIFLLGVTLSCSKKVAPEPVSQSQLLLGTACRITLYDKQDGEIFIKGFDRIKEIEERMDFHTTGSEIAQINQRGYLEPVKVSRDTFLVIERSLEMAKVSGGAFDPTVGPLVEAWGIGGDNPRRPDQTEIDALLKLVDSSKVILNPESLTVRLLIEGMKLD
jgi:thiamine biosynthesis lipoprotein